MHDRIIELSKAIYPILVDLRRELHRWPELGYGEYRTAAIIQQFLNEHGISYAPLGDSTGIVALIEGKKAGKTLGVRADMDGLPIVEDTGLEYASKTQGIMHACGHDFHMAIALGAAYVLKQLEDELAGNVKLVFQPSEEDGTGGYKAVYQWGVLESPHVDAFLGMHVFPDHPVGQICLKEGVMASAIGEAHLTIKGRGGHASAPHLTVDPLLTGCRVVEAIQSIISRETDPRSPAVLSVTMFHAGQKVNVIPQEATISASLRSDRAAQVEEIYEKVKRIAAGIAAASGAECEISGGLGVMEVINDQAVTAQFAEAAAKIVGRENVLWADSHLLSSDDFAYYAKEVPSTYVRLGIGNEAIGAVYSIHNPKFCGDERVVKIGTAAVAQFAVDFLSHQGSFLP